MSSESAPGSFKRVRLPWWGRLLRLVLYGCFWVIARTALRLRVTMLESETEVFPGGLCVAHHKSDLDTLVALPVVTWWRRTRRAGARAAVFAGEDMHQRGYIAGYVLKKPRWLSFLLYRLSVSKFLNAIGWYGVPHGRKRYLRSHLEDILTNEGNLPLSEVMESPETYFAEAGCDARVGDVLGWENRDALFGFREFSIFKLGVMNRLLQRHKQRIAASLPVFSDVVDNGGVVFISPHGGLAPDGLVSSFKSGMFQIIDATTGDAAVIPLNMTYDVLTRGRVSVFLTIGHFLLGAKKWPKDLLEKELRDSIVGATTVTLSHLTSSFLRQQALSGRSRLIEREFRAEMFEQARQMAGSGFLVDARLLKERSFLRRWERFMAYAVDKRLLVRSNGTLQFDPHNVLDGSIHDKSRMKPWVMCANELDALLKTGSARWTAARRAANAG